MAIADLKNVWKIFQGAEPTPEEKKELYREALLMTLARASSADTNIKPVEVKTVQKVLSRELGEVIDAADIRVAAASKLFETTPLEKYLAKVGRKLDTKDRVSIIRCLSEVIQSDLRISPFEIDFFDMVAKALNATPAELAGLTTDK